MTIQGSSTSESESLPNLTAADDIASEPYSYEINNGTALYYYGRGNYRILNMSFYDVYNAIQFNTPTDGSQFWISGVEISAFVYGILVSQFTGNGFIDQALITGTLDDAGTFQYAVGIRIDQGDGYQISDCLITQCPSASFVISPVRLIQSGVNQRTNAVINVYVSNTQFDVASTENAIVSIPAIGAYVTGYGVDITNKSVGIGPPISPVSADEPYNYVSFIHFTNCTATAATNDGFYFECCDRIELNNCSAFSNGHHGVYVRNRTDFTAMTPPNQSVNQFHIQGGQFFNNGTLGIRAYDGIYIEPNTNNFSIVNAACSASVDDNNNNRGSQRFGITISGLVAGVLNDCSGVGASSNYTALSAILCIGSGSAGVYRARLSRSFHARGKNGHDPFHRHPRPPRQADRLSGHEER